MRFFQATAVIAGMVLLPSSLLIPLPAAPPMKPSAA